MSEKEEVISTIRATLLSCKGSLSLKAVNCDYRELQGESIPFTKLGFKSLIELFKSIPGFRLSQGPDGDWLIDVIPSQITKNLADLVARQKTSKKGSGRFSKPPPRRLKNESWKPTASSKYWQYKHTNLNTKHNDVYFKPQSPVKKKPSTLPRPIIKNSGDVNYVNNNEKVSANTKSRNSSLSSSESQKPLPVSSLSGFRPGDILAKAVSNNPSNVKHDEKVHPVVVRKRSSAADRMAALKIRLQNEPDITLDVSPIDDIKEKIAKLNIDTKYKENKARLIELTKLMNLPEPVIKTYENKSKGRYPSTYDCSVKVSSEYSFSTYPDSLNTLELAVETAASKALEKLLSVAVEKNSKPSTSPTLALSRVVQIVNEHPNGLWASGLPDIYLEKFGEMLPPNWMNLVEQSPQIETEKGATGLVMLLPAEEKIVSSSSSISNISNEDSVYPPQLQYPEDSQWNVFIMSANSTVEIWLRIIGEQYSDAFEALNTEMELYFNDGAVSSNNIIIGGWYAIKCEDGWLRARVLDINYLQKTAICFLVDTGDEETHPFSSLYDLPQQFLNVAPQAILCRLAGLEEYSVAGKSANYNLGTLLVGKVLIAEILQSSDDINSKDDPTITVVLFDTSTNEDLNLNKELLHQLTHEAKSPQLSHGITEVYVCEVTLNGTVYAQIHNEYWKLLQKMLKQVVDGPFPKEALQASCGPLLPKPNAYYLAKCSSGEWRRAVLQSNLINSIEMGETCVDVKYIDYGNSERLPVKDVLLLERVSEALNSYPVQVLKLSLYNVTNINRDNLKRLNELLPRNIPVLCKQALLGNNYVEIFVRTQPNNVLYCVNNAINMEIELAKKTSVEQSKYDPMIELSRKKERIFQNINQTSKDNLLVDGRLKSYKLPEKGSQFNVFVTLAANPYNFIIQPLQDQDELRKMMEDLQLVSNLPKLNGTPTVGNVYAAFYDKDQSWYRVSVQGLVSQEKASIYFCDYGDLQMVEISKLRELPKKFKQLAAQALRARLYGVSPINKDWSVEDCLRFQEMVIEKNFVSIIENVECDPLHTKESLLNLNLIDTSTENDVYINKLLIGEGRAKLK